MSLSRVAYDVPSAEVLDALTAWNDAFLAVERCKTRAFMAKRAQKELSKIDQENRIVAEHQYKLAAESLHRAMSRVR